MNRTQAWAMGKSRACSAPTSNWPMPRRANTNSVMTVPAIGLSRRQGNHVRRKRCPPRMGALAEQICYDLVIGEQRT